MRKLLIAILPVLLLTACAVEQRMHRNPRFANRVCNACGGRDTLMITERDTFIREYRDTLIQSPSDTAYQRIRFACDSLGNVYISEINGKTGRITNLLSLLKNNELEIWAVKKHEQVLLKKIREYERRVRARKEKQITHIEVPVPFIPWWVKWLLYPLSAIGSISLLYIMIRYVIPWIIRITVTSATGIDLSVLSRLFKGR